MQFTVENMTCQHCVRAITQALQAADAQAQVNIDLSQKRLTLQSQLSAEQVTAILAEEGYQAEKIA